MNALPDDIIELIIEIGTFVCIDCDDTRYYRIKKCSNCNICACKYHTKHRFAFDKDKYKAAWKIVAFILWHF